MQSGEEASVRYPRIWAVRAQQGRKGADADPASEGPEGQEASAQQGADQRL